MKVRGGVKHMLCRTMGWLVVVGIAACEVAAIVSGCCAEAGEKQFVHLYFADATRPFLVAETRVMVDPADPVTLGRQLVIELINGPASGNLATLPPETKLRSFFLLNDGTAVVDFTPHLRDNHPGGCRQEQLTLFSVVNTLILNVEAIRQVKILIEGTPIQTLTGHLPLDFPLTADMLLTR